MGLFTLIGSAFGEYFINSHGDSIFISIILLFLVIVKSIMVLTLRKFSVNTLMNKFYILIILTFFMSSCTMSFEFKGLLSYYDHTKTLAPELMKKPDSIICHLNHEDKPVVYLINALQLKECLMNIDKAIVYEWSANCNSEVCIPLNLAQSFADKNNLDLFVVAEYYDVNAMNRMYTLKRPIFGKDIDFYSTNFTHRYNYMFYTELFGFSPEDESGRFHYFEKGEWKASYHSLNDYLVSNSNLLE